MSIIVHAPQGCGKPLAASLLKRAFHLEVTWNDGEYVDRELYSTKGRRLPVIEVGREPYGWARHHAADFKASRILFLTSTAPPDDLRHSRRVIPFDDALAMAAVVGVRTYLADWPRAQAIQAITARSLLEAVGVVPQLHSKPLFNAVNRVMTDLGWTRVRLRQPGEAVTWAYRPSSFKESAHA